MTASTIPAFLTSFLDAVTPIVADTLLGPPTTNEETTGLYIGADQNGAAPIDFDQDWAGSGSGARNESYTVPCLLFERTGDSDQATVEDLLESVMGTFEELAALFRPLANFGIEGKTFRVLITRGSLILLPRQAGLLARVAFTITAQARI